MKEILHWQNSAAISSPIFSCFAARSFCWQLTERSGGQIRNDYKSNREAQYIKNGRCTRIALCVHTTRIETEIEIFNILWAILHNLVHNFSSLLKPDCTYRLPCVGRHISPIDLHDILLRIVSALRCARETNISVSIRRQPTISSIN
jgi:hypothetical protein